MSARPTKETVTVLLVSAPEPVKVSKFLKEIVIRHGGEEGRLIEDSDSRLYCFSQSESALRCAFDIRAEASGLLRKPLRMALASGKVNRFDGALFGPPVALAEVLLSSANPGQLLAPDGLRNELVGVAQPEWSICDLGEHRFRELPKRLRVWQLSVGGERETFPLIRSLVDRPHNLPNDSTSFVGRAADIEAIEDYLTFSRVVNLLGTGGAGKTRLAIQAGHELLRHFSDGVFMVRLVDSEEGVHIPSLIAQVLKVDPKDLDHHLSDKQMLLILDNCEHVAEDVYAVVRRFLESHCELCFLLTSRHPILPGVEQEHYVEPLSLPADDRTAAQFMRGEAVKLFLERLLLYRPNYPLNEESAQLIARICARLEGLPLAIELAAARARLLSLEQVYEALDDELALLRRTDDRPETLHGTMVGTIEWSFRLLDYHESRLLSRLSVLVGGFTAASASAVADFGDLPSMDSALDQLVAKSLIFPIESPTYESRFRMLEPIRQYAGSLLEDHGEVLERLLDWCLHVTRDTDQLLAGPNVTSVLRSIDADLPNVRTALHFALAHAPERALQLALNLHRYWIRSSNHGEGRRWAQRSLEFFEPPQVLKAQALNLIGSSCYLSNDLEEAATYLHESLAIYEKLEIWDRFAVLAGNVAMVEVQLGNRKQAERHFQESVEILRRGEDRVRLLNGIANLANFYRDEEPEIALRYLGEAIELSREIGERFQECHCLAMAATVQAETGRFEQARESLLGFLRLHDYPDPKRCLMALEAATRLALEESDPRRARRWLQICDRLRHETGITPGARNDRIEDLRGRIRGAGLVVELKQKDTPATQLRRTLSQVEKWLSKTGPVEKAP